MKEKDIITLSDGKQFKVINTYFVNDMTKAIKNSENAQETANVWLAVGIMGGYIKEI